MIASQLTFYTLYLFQNDCQSTHFITSQVTFFTFFDDFLEARFFFFFFQKTVEKRCKKKHTYDGFCDIEVEHLCCLSPNNNLG
jgi:hypothetical protein